MSLIYWTLETLLDLIIKNVILLICLYTLNVLYRKSRKNTFVSSNGKAVLITGCDSGFGNRLAERLNQIGFKVYATVLSQSSDGAQQLQKKSVFPNKIMVLQMDVTKDKDVTEVFEKVNSDLKLTGHELWAVVNNAGIGSTCPLEWGTIDNYYTQFEVNVFGTVRVTRVFLPLIRASNGRIINIVSMFGSFSMKLAGIYCMSKHSLIAFSDTLRREISKFNVKVSTIEPSFFRTSITDTKSLVKHLKDNWDQSSDEVKAFYKNCDYETKLIENLENLVQMGNEINIVVDDIIDSVMNCRPKTSYRPRNGIIDSLLVWLSIYLPNNIVDKLMELQEKLFVK